MRAIAAVKVPTLVGILVAVFCSSAKDQAIYTDKDGNFAPQTGVVILTQYYAIFVFPKKLRTH
jgi:hypothetical protein